MPAVHLPSERLSARALRSRVSRWAPTYTYFFGPAAPPPPPPPPGGGGRRGGFWLGPRLQLPPIDVELEGRGGIHWGGKAEVRFEPGKDEVEALWLLGLEDHRSTRMGRTD